MASDINHYWANMAMDFLAALPANNQIWLWLAMLANNQLWLWRGKSQLSRWLRGYMMGSRLRCYFPQTELLIALPCNRDPKYLLQATEDLIELAQLSCTIFLFLPAPQCLTV